MSKWLVALLLQAVSFHMRIAQIHLRSRVDWRITNDSPLVLEGNLAGFSIVNPLFIAQLSNTDEASWATFPTESEVIFTMSSIGLIVAGNVDVYTLEPYISALFACLEDISGQLGLSSTASITGCGYTETTFPEKLHFPEVSHLPALGLTKKSRIERAISPVMVKEALHRVTLQQWPSIARELLHNAANAFDQGDFRMAILLAAIAAESLAQSSIEEARDSRLANGPPSPSENDAIFKKLIRSARGDFRMWLHEMPLFVMGRSMLDEDKPGYDAALKLHKTRNQIVHRGNVGKGKPEELLPVSRFGALEALKSANRFFAWYGEKPIGLPFEDLASIPCRNLFTYNVGPLAYDYAKQL